MRNLKKMMALVLAVVMVLAMGVVVNAATITINSGSSADTATTETTEYTYYQIFDASIKTSGTVNAETGELTTAGTVAYTIPATNSTLANAINALAVDSDDMFTVTLSGDGTVYTVVLNKKADESAFTGEEIANALNTDAIKNAAIATGTFAQTTPGGTASKNDLNPGYYLILSSLGTKLAVQTLDEVTINEKNTYPSNTKAEDKTTASIGEVVTYTVTVVIPANVAEKEIKVVDTITDGLTLNTAITVAGSKDDGLTSLTFTQTGTRAAQAAVEANPEADPPVEAKDAVKAAKIYTATIPAATVKANAGQTLTLTYTATVNSNAVVNDAEKNDAHIEYDHFVSKDVEVEVKTHGFTVKKIDGANVTSGMTDAQKFALTALDGAEFSLWTAAENGTQIYVKKVGDVYRADVSKTVDDSDNKPDAIAVGEGTIEGLAAGTYYLQEDKAPTGYNPLTARQAIDVSATTSAAGVDIAVENNAGATLPSTGGIGTTIFYIVGAILVIGAGVLLVARKRMGSK